MSELSEDAVVRRAHDRLGFGSGGSALAAAQARDSASVIGDLLTTGRTDRGVTETPAPGLARLDRPDRDEKPGSAAKKNYRQARRAQQQELIAWWLERMVRAEHPTVERLTWFWHGHFATSLQKVKQPALMLAQNETLRRLALGDFGSLAQAMVVDPAMLVWLDGNDNTVEAPNENLSREFMELFTLGHGGYSENDIREAARALTGWKINRQRGIAVLRPRQQDRGSKTILGRTADFDARSFVTQVLAQPASAEFVTRRLWFRLVSTTPPPPDAIERMTVGHGHDRNVVTLLRAITDEPAFRDSSCSLVKQPVEWTVGLLRAAGVRPSDLEPRQRKKLAALLRGMGQVPFLPPSVGGWPAGGAWLTTAAALSRMNAATVIGQAVRWSAKARRTPTAQRPEYLRRMLGIDQLSGRTSNAIAQVDSWPAALAVAACSPEYVVSR